MRIDADYQFAKKALVAQTRLERIRAAQAERDRRLVESSIEECLDEIRAAGEVKPGSEAEIALLTLMVAKRCSRTTAKSRPDFLIGDEGE